ncbi:MAG: ABA4-like family protein [Caulobacter sp.]|nr:ABA4-like family protein [Caulobacter sp.]
MDLEQIFSAMGLLAMAGWLCLALAPLRRPALIAAARVAGALLALAYVILIIRGMTAPGGPEGGGFGSLAQVMVLFSVPAVMLPAWIHYLCFDLWIGTWAAEDAPKSGVPHWLMLPIFGLTFMFGPVGLLAYLIARFVVGWFRPKAG